MENAVIILTFFQKLSKIYFKVSKDGGKGICVGDVDKPMIECEVFQKKYRDDL